MGSLDNQTTKQVLAVDTNCQNFTGKRKIKECELLPLTSSQEANTIHGGEGEEKNFKKRKIRREKGKKKDALPAASVGLLEFSLAGSCLVAR